MSITVGIDEVGRGAWAGPLVVGAVALDSAQVMAWWLQDSKKLTSLRRDEANKLITEACKSYGLGWVSAKTIDEVGLTQAMFLATELALSNLDISYDRIIIDGNINYLPGVYNVECMVGADALVPAVGAASIVAKVARDKYMAKIAKKFPQYGFEKHVGYGTAAHSTALKIHGPCEIHRYSFKPIKLLQTLK